MTFGTLGGRLFFTFGDQLVTILPFLRPVPSTLLGRAHAGPGWGPCLLSSHPWSPSALDRALSREDRGRGQGLSSQRRCKPPAPPAEEPRAVPERTYVTGRQARAGSLGSEHLTPWQAQSQGSLGPEGRGYLCLLSRLFSSPRCLCSNFIFCQRDLERRGERGSQVSGSQAQRAAPCLVSQHGEHPAGPYVLSSQPGPSAKPGYSNCHSEAGSKRKKSRRVGGI